MHKRILMMVLDKFRYSDCVREIVMSVVVVQTASALGTLGIYRHHESNFLACHIAP